MEIHLAEKLKVIRRLENSFASDAYMTRLEADWQTCRGAKCTFFISYFAKGHRDFV